MDPLHKTLSETKVEDFPCPKGAVIVVDSTETFESAFSKLVSGRVLSAPVFDAKAKSYIGFLDLRDLVSLVLLAYKELNGKHTNCKNLDELLRCAKSMYKGGPEGPSVSYLARRNPFVPIQTGTTLLDILNLLTKDHHGLRVHRIPVMKDGNVINIISQMSLVKFVSKHLEECPLAQKTVEQLSLGTSPAISVRETASAASTFEILDAHQRSGLAIVDESGRLTGNVSGRDMKQFITKPVLEQLNMPVRSFLNIIHQTDDVDIMFPSISVHREHTFAHVVKKMAAANVHRVYIVDSSEHYHPIGVISCTDIIKKLH